MENMEQAILYRKIFESEASVTGFFSSDLQEVLSGVKKVVVEQMDSSLKSIYYDAMEHGRISLDSDLPAWLLNALPPDIEFQYRDGLQRCLTYVYLSRLYMVYEKYEVMWIPSEVGSNKYQVSYKIIVYAL